jgi:hypothetical protein
MIAILVYAIGFAWLCCEAARHGALGLIVTSLWVWAVALYAVGGAAICRAVARRTMATPKPPRRDASELIRAAREADAKARASEVTK